jgi:hypothetical protein
MVTLPEARKEQAMETIIVVLDCADYARQLLAPMVGATASTRVGGTHWVLVACPPRLPRHVARWVSHDARDSWRAEWARQALARIAPALQQRGDTVTPVLAEGVLVRLTDKLIAQHAASRVLDARRPKFGEQFHPVTRDQPERADARWEVPGAVAGMGAFLLLAAD